MKFWHGLLILALVLLISPLFVMDYWAESQLDDARKVDFVIQVYCFVIVAGVIFSWKASRKTRESKS